MVELTPENDDFFCANESLIKIDHDLTIRTCATWEKYCLTTVETSLKAFSAIVRTCGDTCRELCESDGYGTDMVRCDDCCTEDYCNGNYSVRYYTELMKQQYTSWIEPLMGEKLYNRLNNITFPY
ncbi:Chromosomal replication initiator protein DnaA [Dirofilaria immitis]